MSSFGCLVNSVPAHYRKAILGATLSSAAFNSINSLASPESVQTWSAEEVHAQWQRVKDVTVMDIYDIRMKQCKSVHLMILLTDIMFQTHHAQKYFLH